MARKQSEESDLLGILGAAFGIASIITFITVWISLLLGVAGIVFSVLQMRHLRTKSSIIGFVASVTGMSLALFTLLALLFWLSQVIR